MTKLERLTQDEFGRIFQKNSTSPIDSRYLLHCGKIMTINLENPVIDIEQAVEEWAEKYPDSVPKSSNKYTISNFNGSTQHAIKNDDGKEKIYSVYAIQFYHTFD